MKLLGWANAMTVIPIRDQTHRDTKKVNAQKRRPEDRLPADNTAASPPPKGVCLFCRLDKFFFKKIRTFHMNPSNHKSDSDQRLVA